MNLQSAAGLADEALEFATKDDKSKGMLGFLAGSAVALSDLKERGRKADELRNQRRKARHPGGGMDTASGWDGSSSSGDERGSGESEGNDGNESVADGSEMEEKTPGKPSRHDNDPALMESRAEGRSVCAGGGALQKVFGGEAAKAPSLSILIAGADVMTMSLLEGKPMSTITPSPSKSVASMSEFGDDEKKRARNALPQLLDRSLAVALGDAGLVRPGGVVASGALCGEGNKEWQRLAQRPEAAEAHNRASRCCGRSRRSPSP